MDFYQKIQQKLFFFCNNRNNLYNFRILLKSFIINLILHQK